MAGHNEEYAEQELLEYVPAKCMLECDEEPIVAYQYGYGKDTTIRTGRSLWTWTRWIYVCASCQTEEKGLAPYWWNKALRGEALGDEEE